MRDSVSSGRENRDGRTESTGSGDGVRRRTILGFAASGGVFGAMGLSSVPVVTTASSGCAGGQCDLTVSKDMDSEFTVTGGGTFRIEVCNVGQDPCDEPVTVVDTLPPSMTFESVSGTDWSAVDTGDEIVLDHPNYTSIQPGECLPDANLTVSFDPGSNFPPDQIENCLGVTTCDDDNGNNDEDCETVCLSRTSTYCAGTPDGFDPNTSYEVSVQSQGLQARLDRYSSDPDMQREFDEGGSNAAFGHSFLNIGLDAPYGEICGATLEARLRPEGGGAENDRIVLGFFGEDNASGWGHYIGNEDGNDGLYNGDWNSNNTGATTFTPDLGELPTDTGDTSLIDELNQYGYLDVFVQDDTAVDYLRLTVEYCCPPESIIIGRKYPIVDFPVGGIGTYAIDVEYAGEDAVDGIEVVDHLPGGLSYHGAEGTGWSVEETTQQDDGGDTGDAGTVTAVYDEAVQPGEVLPSLYLDVALDPNYEYVGNIVENRVHVSPVSGEPGTEARTTHYVTPE